MIDEELYRETFSKLRASGEAKKEIFMNMQEQKNKRRFPKILRAGLIAAVLVVALAVTASAAGNDILGFITIHLTPVSDDGVERVLLDDEGNEWREVNIAATTELRDGRLMLKALAQEVDITDELEENGTITETFYHGEHDLTVTVTGTIEQHFISTSSESDAVTFTERPYDENWKPEGQEIIGEESVGIIFYEDETNEDSAEGSFFVTEEDGKTAVSRK